MLTVLTLDLVKEAINETCHTGTPPSANHTQRTTAQADTQGELP